MAHELRPEGLQPTAEQDGGDCIHGCNGDCISSGSERCNFTCHERMVAAADWISPGGTE